MYTIINGQNYTSQVSKVALSVTMSDPMPTATIDYDDMTVNGAISPLSDVILWDESALDANGNALIPSVNSMIDPTFKQGVTKYALDGDSTGIITFPSGQQKALLTFSNTSGNAFVYQQIQEDYITAGVSYCFSAYVNSSSPSNIGYFIQVSWLDGSSNIISSINAGFAAPPTSRTRVSCSGAAPSSAVTAYVQVGGFDLNGTGTNSGTITFDSLQFEPMWFSNYVLTGGTAVTYPSPDCNFNQATSVLLPDGTASRMCRLFAGVVKAVHLEKEEGHTRYWELGCNGLQDLVDNGALVDRIYTLQTDAYIINDIVSTYYQGLISTGQMNATAPTSTVQVGYTVNAQNWLDRNLRDVLNTLAEQTGFTFFVDPYGFLHYNDLPWDYAPFTVSRDDTPDRITIFAPEKWMYDNDATQIRNAIKVLGGTTQRSDFDQFTGDGTTTKFTLSYVPDSVTSITISGSLYAPTGTHKMGTAGSDVNGINNVVALVNPSAATVTFNTAPANAATVVINYLNTVGVVSQQEDVNSIADYRAYWATVSDTTLTDKQTASLRGLSETQKWAQPVFNAYFTITQTQGSASAFVYPGTSITLQSAIDGLNAQSYPVVQLSATFSKAGFNQFSYECGTYRPSFKSHVRNVQRVLGRSTGTSGTTPVLEYHASTQDKVTLSDANGIAVTIAAPVTAVWSSARYGFASYA